MPYIPTEWKTGDVITADKLNKIEDAIVGLSLLSDGTFKITKEGNDLEIIPVEAETELENGVVTIKCTLSGSGVQSPSNVRDLNGLNEITIAVENEENSDETAYNIDLPEEAGTVYGGTLDLTTGVLTVTHIKATYPTSNTVAKSGASVIPAGRHCYYVRVPNSEWSGGDNNPRGLYFECSIYPIGTQSYTEMLTKTEFSMGIGSSGGVNSSIGFNTDIDNLVDFNEWLSNANCQVVYPIATPVEYNLDPLIIKAMYDKNIVSTNADKISVTFNCSIKTYIDEKNSDGSGNE